jgi:hypothetical protein
MAMTVREVGRQGDIRGEDLSVAVMHNYDQGAVVRGLEKGVAKSLACCLYGKVRVTIEPVED